MGKKQSDVSNRQNKNERKKKKGTNESIYTSKHVRAKEALLSKRIQIVSQGTQGTPKSLPLC